MVKIARRLRLGDLLVRHRWIRSEQLHQALTNQLTIGGRLGTNLVETDALSLDQVGEALGVQHGVPVATPELLDQVERSTLRQIQPAFCAARGLLPLVISDRTLHLAMLDPPRVEEIRQLTAAKGIVLDKRRTPPIPFGVSPSLGTTLEACFALAPFARPSANELVAALRSGVDRHEP